jgi:hypothetical protein
MASLKAGRGAGEGENGRGGRRRRGRWKGRGKLEVEDKPDRWAPPVGEREREKRRRVLVGHWAGSGEAGRVWMGRRFGFVFFSNPFQTNFKPFLNQIFYIFSNSNFNTNFSNYFKGFSQTILTTFQTYFKFKPLHKFSQLFFSQLFLRTFSQIF